MKGHTRIYKGGCYPARFWAVTWCKPEEIPKRIEEGWVVDTENLFGPDGKYPTEEPLPIKKEV